MNSINEVLRLFLTAKPLTTMRIVFSLLVALSLSIFSFAQSPQEIRTQLEGPNPEVIEGSGIKFQNLAGVVAHDGTEVPWNPQLFNGKFAHDVENKTELEAMKAEKTAKKFLTQNRSAESSSATYLSASLIDDFQGNTHNGWTPPDNDIAVSNAGRIVSVTNSAIFYLNSSGAVTYNASYSTFFSTYISGLSASIFDPVVAYDSESDRFVMVVLHGNTSTTSQVLVCFSQTNNPADGWNVYSFAGNFKSDGSWFDYPKLAINKEEVWVTGNLFFNSGGGFNEAIILQIDKTIGYAGGSVPYQTYLGTNRFTVTPCRNAFSTQLSQGMFFVSSSSGGSSNYRLHIVNDDLSGTPTLTNTNVSTTAYSPSGDAAQSGTTRQLDNGDCRILSAYYQSPYVHFVHMHDVGSGWNGVRYVRLDVTGASALTRGFGNVGNLDYSYPAITSFSTDPTRHESIITFQASGPSAFPSVRAFTIDNDAAISPSISVKSGTGFVAIGSGLQRWGDYIGMAKKYNATTREAWCAAAFGNSSNNYTTWIGKFGGLVSGLEDQSVEPIESKVYPNPIIQDFALDFELTERTRLQVELYSLSGGLVKTLYAGRGKPGKNTFKFNKGVLPAGQYLLTITDESKTQSYAQKKIVILD